MTSQHAQTTRVKMLWDDELLGVRGDLDPPTFQGHFLSISTVSTAGTEYIFSPVSWFWTEESKVGQICWPKHTFSIVQCCKTIWNKMALARQSNSDAIVLRHASNMNLLFQNLYVPSSFDYTYAYILWYVCCMHVASIYIILYIYIYVAGTFWYNATVLLSDLIQWL